MREINNETPQKVRRLDDEILHNNRVAIYFPPGTHNSTVENLTIQGAGIGTLFHEADDNRLNTIRYKETQRGFVDYKGKRNRKEHITYE